MGALHTHGSLRSLFYVSDICVTCTVRVDKIFVRIDRQNDVGTDNGHARQSRIANQTDRPVPLLYRLLPVVPIHILLQLKMKKPPQQPFNVYNAFTRL